MGAVVAPAPRMHGNQTPFALLEALSMAQAVGLNGPQVVVTSSLPATLACASSISQTTA